jgi:hypothetical protein
MYAGVDSSAEAPLQADQLLGRHPSPPRQARLVIE